MFFKGKKGLILVSLMIVLSLWVYADSAAPDYYQYQVRYSSGTSLQGWTTQCNTNPSNDGDDWSSGYSCSKNGLGSPSNPNPSWCDQESTVQIQWRMYHEPNGGASYTYTTTSWQDMYSINWDSDSNDCTCHGDVWVAGKCCGDDGSSDDFCAGGYTACLDGSYLNNADSSPYVCECGVGGSQGECNTAGETGCWDSTTSDCCGDDGASDDFCAGGYTSCYDGSYLNDADSSPYVCECGVGGTQGECNTAGETGCWDSTTSDCCGDDGASDDFCAGGFTACVDGTYLSNADTSPQVCICGGAIYGGGIGFESGTSSACCGDDGSEYYKDEVGAVDGSDSDYCCDKAGDCVDDNTCYDDMNCHDTGSSASFNEYCDSGTWHNNDDSSVYCTACVGASHYNIGGDIGACCGDDSNENRIFELGATDGTSSDACCNAADKCVDDNTCYLSNSGAASCHDTGSSASFDEYCDTNTWYDNDDTQNYCDACVGVGHYDIGGEISQCCGDDANENVIWEVGDTDGMNSDACCNAASDCVDDNTCYSSGACRDTGSTLSDWPPNDREYCNAGTWQEQDRSSTACSACGTGDWNINGADNEPGINGDTNCCGDDANENLIFELGATDGTSSDACCNAADKCVDDDACYANTACHDTGSGDSITEYCDAGTWMNNDDSQTYCDTCTGAGHWDVGFEAGTNPTCCEDDPGETYVVEQGCAAGDCIDNASSDFCCNANTDCVDDDTCYPSASGAASCHDTGGTASVDEFCNAGTWYDDDDAQAYCDGCVGAGNWNTGFGPGTEGLCCGDDAPNEFHIYENDSALYDLANSDMCCNSDVSCVDDNQCFTDGSYDDLEENEPSVGVQTFDRELCDGDTSLGYGDNNDWHDADENEDFCSIAHTPTTQADQALSCSPLADCWVPEGESGGAFGGYAAGNYVQGCCGDDSGENYIMTDYFNDACCDNSGDFVAYNGTCQIKSDRVYLYGRVMGQIPNGTYVPLYHALIQAVDPVYGRLVNQNYTNHDGYYNISAVKGIRYSLELRPSEAYDGKTVVLPIINVDTKTDFYITLLSSCREDCTSFNLEDNKYYCDKDCDGTNGCSFNQSVVSDSPLYPPGSTMKELCDELSPGWTVFHNSTYDIQCCNQGYVLKPEYKTASVSLDSTYSHVDSYYGGMVSYYGKFLSVWVAMGED